MNWTMSKSNESSSWIYKEDGEKHFSLIIALSIDFRMPYLLIGMSKY